jgi:hypothetical protein
MSGQGQRNARLLGVAFLLQFVTSFISGVFLQPSLIVADDIDQTMRAVAENSAVFATVTVLDMATALGVIFLGVMLYFTVKDAGPRMALVGLCFYVLEATLLAASKLAGISLLRVSQEYVAGGDAAGLPIIADLAVESMEFVGGTLHLLAFCAGAILFYFLLDASRVVPRWLSLWGLVTVWLLMVWTVLAVFDYEVPFVLYLPYVPFELVIGIWLVVRGFSEPD